MVLDRVCDGYVHCRARAMVAGERRARWSALRAAAADCRECPLYQRRRRRCSAWLRWLADLALATPRLQRPVRTGGVPAALDRHV
jgi:uracil-DNA glycosylase